MRWEEQYPNGNGRPSSISWRSPVWNECRHRGCPEDLVSMVELETVFSQQMDKVVQPRLGGVRLYPQILYPYWKQSDYRKKMFEGNPEED